MTTSDSTVREQLYYALVDDPILAMLGFDHRSIGFKRSTDGPELVLTWSGEWYGSTRGLLGTVTIEPVGVDERTRVAVLDRVERALAELRARGPIARVRRSGRPASTMFQVLTRATASHVAPSAVVSSVQH